MMGMLLISAHILDPLWKLQSSMMWDKETVIKPEVKTSYTTEYQEAFQKYMQTEFCSNYRHVPVTKPERVPCNNPFPSATASGSDQSSFDRYDVPSDDQE